MTNDDRTAQIRGLYAALEFMSPAEVWDAIQKLSPLATTPAGEEPNQYLATCRMCGWEFWTALKPTGSKWTSTCHSCIADEL